MINIGKLIKVSLFLLFLLCFYSSADRNSLVPTEIEGELYEDVFTSRSCDQDSEKSPEEDFYEEEEEYVDVAENRTPVRKPEKKKLNKGGDKRLPKTPPTTPHTASATNLEYDQMFYCKWDTLADGEEELDVKFGEVVTILSRKFEDFGWWVGKGVGGEVGLVPKDYLTPAYRLVS